jgi:hypothetical protein
MGGLEGTPGDRMEDGGSGREMWAWEVFWRDGERYMDIGK